MPREYVTGETIDSVLDLLRRSDLPAQLEACASFADAAGLAERLRLAAVPGDDRDCQGNAARCAVELALLDAYGRRFACRFAAVTSCSAADLYQPRPWSATAGPSSRPHGFKARLAAWDMRVYRFNQSQGQSRHRGQDDAERCAKSAAVSAPRMDLRIDANEAWTPAEVVEPLPP